MSPSTPITRFLGTVAFEHGPFGLLGLEPKEHPPGAINQALRSRLAKLANHPHGMSTEADEVRLALEVAAAQLRDVTVQREILADLEMAPRSGADDSGPAGLPTPRLAPASGSAKPAADPSMTAFENAALMVLVHSGGWNVESQRRLGALAHSFGLERGAFEDAVRSLGESLRARVARQARNGDGRARRASGSPGDPGDDAGLEEGTPAESPTSPRHLLRLGLLPMLFLVFAKYAPVSVELKRVLVVEAAMPTGVFAIIMARHYDGDPPTALCVIVGTSLIALATIPRWLQCGMWWVDVAPL